MFLGYTIYIVGFPGDARQQTADTADNHIHLHAGLGGFGQFVDQLPVGHGIELEGHGSIFSLFGAVNLFVDMFDHPFFQRKRRGDQVRILAIGHADQHILKEVIGVFAYGLVCCDQAEVGIQTRGRFVVVSGSNLGDIMQLIVRYGGDQTDFGMGFIVVKANEFSSSTGSKAEKILSRRLESLWVSV